MEYVTRSHRIRHAWHRFQTNRLSLDYCARRLDELEIVQATGRPGDAFLFDSNGAHRGVRRGTGRTRDVFLVEYNTDPSNVYGGEISPWVLHGLGANALRALTVFRTRVPRWHWADAEGPTWARSLYAVERWL